MTQNISHAVMAQRFEPAKSLDYFPTPPWATRALCEWLKAKDYSNETHVVLEPACGEGHMSRALQEYFREVVSADVADYGYGEVKDFLKSDFGLFAEYDWIITNPPFNRACEFSEHALKHARIGVAMLVRTNFIEGVGRYELLFKHNPPTALLQFCERVPMHKGRLNKNGSTATAYAWVIWVNGTTCQTELHWTGRVRKRLEREEDYK